MIPYVLTGSNFSIFESVECDAWTLAPLMRKSDRDEIKASHDAEPLGALLRGLKFSSPCLTLRYRSQICAMFGVSGGQTVWLLGSDEIQKFPILFMALGREIIDLFLKDYPVLSNYVDCRNKTSIRWLKNLGAVFQDPIPYGHQQKPFMKFTLKRAD